jgi:hypothetical protein
MIYIYYEFTCKTSFSGRKPALSGIARVPDNQPLEVIESEIAGALNSSEVTLNSAKVDLESEFRRRRELAESGIETHGIYAKLGTIEVIIF